MPLFSSTQPSIRARILPRFPAQVLAGNGMVITKSGGTYVFSATSVVPTLGHLPDITSDRLLGRDTAGTGPPEELTVGGGLTFNASGGVELSTNQRFRSLPVLFPAVAAAQQQDFMIPLTCTISQVTMLANVVGSAVVDIWKDTYVNFPPTAADTITAAAKPTISATNKYQDSILTGWTKTVAAGDILRINIDSVTTITRLAIFIDVVTT
jgi:hypothetical protein